MNTFKKVYAVVSSIPKGCVMTYQSVANLAHVKNARVVGFALNANKNPKEIPCHRVVKSNGKLAGYAFGGTIRKKEILKKEGVFFLDQETVDLKKSLIIV